MPPHMSCYLLFLVFWGRVGLHCSTTVGCPGASTYVLLPFIFGILGYGGPPQLHYCRLPRCLHICLVTFYFWYSGVGWASTAPLLKSAQGPSQPGDLQICRVTFYFWYSRLWWASTAPLLKAAQGPPHMSCHLLFLVFWGRVGLHSSTTEGCLGAFTTRGPPHMSCYLLFFGILGLGGPTQLHY